MSRIGAAGPASCVRMMSSVFPTSARLSIGEGGGRRNSEKTIRCDSQIRERLSTRVPSKSKIISFTGSLVQQSYALSVSMKIFETENDQLILGQMTFLVKHVDQRCA